MVTPARFERATYGLGIRCSILLSYGAMGVILTDRPWARQGSPREHWREASAFRRLAARDMLRLRNRGAGDNGEVGRRGVACGYIYVVSLPGMARGERRIGGSGHHPFDVAARWERVSWTNATVKLHSMAFVCDVSRTRTALNDQLRRMKAATAASGTGTTERVLRDYIADAMRAAITEDHGRMAARFDSHTGLLLDPSERLSGPPERLVREAVRALQPYVRSGSGNLFREPYAVGLVWSLLELRAHQLHIPLIYVPEMYRSLSAQLWGVRPSNAEMRDVQSVISREAPEYRLGRFAFARFVRAPMSHSASMGRGYRYLADFVADPAAHIAHTYDLYAQTNYSRLSVRVLDMAALALRVALLVAGAVLLDTLWDGTSITAMIQTLIVTFLLGLALARFNLFGRPDTARILGLIGQRDWRDGRRALDRFTAAPVTSGRAIP